MNPIAAHTISTLIHPLLIPSYGMLILVQTPFLTLFPMRMKLMYIFGTLAFTGLFPALFILLLGKLKLVNNHEISNPKERLFPYLFTIISYGFGILFLYRLLFPSWALTLLAGSAIATFVNLVINFRWKISAHLAAIGGLAGGVFAVCNLFRFNPTMLFVGVILGAGLLGTARMTLKQHTLGQVLAGFANGFICVFLSLRFALQFI